MAFIYLYHWIDALATLLQFNLYVIAQNSFHWYTVSGCAFVTPKLSNRNLFTGAPGLPGKFKMLQPTESSVDAFPWQAGSGLGHLFMDLSLSILPYTKWRACMNEMNSFSVTHPLTCFPQGQLCVPSNLARVLLTFTALIECWGEQCRELWVPQLCLEPDCGEEDGDVYRQWYIRGSMSR